MIRLCFDCVLARPRWLERYMLGWYLLLLFGGAAFIGFEGWPAFWAQAIFFAIAFPWTVWPIVAAVRPRKALVKDH